MITNAILAGPARNPNAVRAVQHGTIEATRGGLRMQLEDGRALRLTLQGPTDLLRLARELIFAAECRTAGCLTAEILDSLGTLVTTNAALDAGR